MSSFQASRLDKLVPYQWGLQINDPSIIKLNTNESPYPTSPQVTKAINENSSLNLSKYPDPLGIELKNSISAYYDIKPNNIFLGNGSDDVLSHCFLAFFNQNDSLIVPDISYGLYPVLANLYQVNLIESKSNSDLSLNIENFLLNNAPILIANPNAPSGLLLDKDSIIRILQANPDYLVIIDEAYVDFANGSMVELINEYDNLLIIQTLSKSRSLAGLRIGLALGNEKLISNLHTIRDCINPYNVNCLALKAGTKAFDDKEYFKQTVSAIISTREKFKEDLISLGFSVSDSQTNFVLVTHTQLNILNLYEELLEKKILVRYFDLKEYGQYLRISIGLDQDMQQLYKIIKIIIQESEINL